MRVLEHLPKVVCDAAVLNPYDKMPPWFIQWPDGSRSVRGRQMSTAVKIANWGTE